MTVARLLAAALAGTLAACAQATPTTVHTSPSAPQLPSTPSAAPVALPDGVYVDHILVPVCLNSNPPARCPDYSGPHYFVSLTSTGQRSVRGTLSWVAQDGNTFAVFTFTGTVQSGTATLIVGSLGPGDYRPPSQPVHAGSVVSAHYGKAELSSHWPSSFDGSRALILDGCGNYLTLIETRPDCEFVYSPSGLLSAG